MKKIALFLAVVLVAALTAFAEPTVETTVMMTGTVLEMTEEGILINSAEHGEVLVLSDEETIFETTGDIAVGDYLYIDYSGQMTYSRPPQIYAAVVRMYALEGSVVEHYAEDNAVLLQTETHGEVIVNLPEEWAEQEITVEYMKIYFDGAMTMSLPAQVGAGYVVPGYSVQGAVTQINEDNLLIGEGMEAIEVHFEAGTLPEGIDVGDVIRVIHNGQMTRSIPAQITAMEFVQIGR